MGTQPVRSPWSSVRKRRSKAGGQSLVDASAADSTPETLNKPETGSRQTRIVTSQTGLGVAFTGRPRDAAKGFEVGPGHQGPARKCPRRASPGGHLDNRRLAPARPSAAQADRSSLINRGDPEGPPMTSARSAKGDPERPSSKGELGPCTLVVLSRTKARDGPFTESEGG